ncbi:MAG: hypothetical protein QF886_20320, partial [Planctomycetota bacterium]|nr:hypothetical protein [Planctomycetota bacterium]
MKAALARLHCLFDSPALPRDMASLLSSWRIGTWFLILNLVLGPLLGFMVYIAAFENDQFFSQASQQLGLGQYLAVMLMLGIGGVCTVLIPIRASGLFEGPRWGRYFDQIVLSGISPFRYFGGKVAAQNVFFLLILI